MKELLEAGAHFGHQTRRWNPKMERFIFGERNNIYIIDLQRTLEQVTKAYETAREIAARGGTFLFVGTKRQARDTIEEEANRCGMFFVNHRWLGGTLTNFQTIRKSVAKYESVERMLNEGVADSLPKKERIRLQKLYVKLERNLRGIRNMGRLPDAVFIVDTRREEIAVKEALKLGITSIGLVDTNCDPDLVTIPIPCNDDAIRSVRLFTSLIANAILEGRKLLTEEAALTTEGGAVGSEGQAVTVTSGDEGSETPEQGA